MKKLLLIFACAFMVTADALDVKKGLANKKQPKVVSVYQNGMRKCTGVVIFDLTILTAGECFLYMEAKDINATIKFPNDKKLYKATRAHTKYGQNEKNLDEVLEILTLNEKDEPPKCEWSFQLPESNKHGNKGQVTLLRNYKKKDVVNTMDVTLEDCENNQSTGYNFTRSICVKAGSTWETDYEDVGAPLFLDGIFAGIMRIAEEVSNASIFAYLYYDKEFFKKLPQNPSKDKKVAKKQKTEAAH